MADRRDFIRNSMGALGLLSLSNCRALRILKEEKISYKIGACDWSLGMLSDPEVMKFAQELGLDGVQVSLGSAKNNMHLRNKDLRAKYLEYAKEYNISISGMGISELNNIPFKSSLRAYEWVEDCIDVANNFGCEVILVPFFNNGDIKNDTEGTEEVIYRLKKLSAKAKEKNVILGVESWLSAEEHMYIIDSVRSNNVKIYYDPRNSLQMGYDVFDELYHLGKENICEIHLKENGFLLGEGVLDIQRIKDILVDIHYDGWIIIEGSVPKGHSITESYIHNHQYLDSIFNR